MPEWTWSPGQPMSGGTHEPTSFRTEFEKLNDTKEWTTVFTDETMDDFMVIRRELSGRGCRHLLLRGDCLGRGQCRIGGFLGRAALQENLRAVAAFRSSAQRSCLVRRPAKRRWRPRPFLQTRCPGPWRPRHQGSGLP